MTLNPLTLILSGALVAATPSMARAQQTHILVKVGDHVWLTGDDGWDVKGVVSRVSSDGVDIRGEAGLRHFDLGDIRRVSKPDRLRNGVLIGAGLGAALSGGAYSPSEKAGVVVAGAGIGALLDRANKGRRVTYERAGAATPRPSGAVTPVSDALPTGSPAAPGIEAPYLPVAIGQTLTVTTLAGVEATGVVVGRSATGIDVRSASGAKHVQATDVRRITTPHRSSRGRNIGGLVGGGVVFLGWATAGYLVPAAIIGAGCGGIGYGIGYLFDQAAGGEQTIYEKTSVSRVAYVTPIVTRHSVGIGGSISWK